MNGLWKMLEILMKLRSDLCANIFLIQYASDFSVAWRRFVDLGMNLLTYTHVLFPHFYPTSPTEAVILC